MSDKFAIEIKKRPWYEWLLWAVWAFILVFLYQNAIGSAHELEARAATIFWVMFAVFALGGIAVWFVRRDK